MKSNTNRLTLTAMLIAVSIVGRLAFTFIPNVQPVTDIILASALFIDPISAFLIAFITMLLTGFILGFGPWVLMQIISYTVILLLLVPFRNWIKKHFLIQLILVFIAGLLYGVIISLLNSILFTQSNGFIAYYIAGIPFDLMHAIGNATLYPMIYFCFKQLHKTKKEPPMES